jgi:hypothetical protein
MHYSRITTQFPTITTCFGHHQVVLIQSLSLSLSLFGIPLSLANVESECISTTR